jgi:HlyD family secretion protein
MIMVRRRWSRIAWWAAGLGLAGFALTMALRPKAIAVDAAQVIRGPMRVTIDEEGETRIRRRFVVSAPVTGRLDRIELEPGDCVVRGRTVVARIQAETSPLLDARARAEAEAIRASAASAEGRARAEERRALDALDLAKRELARERELGRQGLTSGQAVELRESAVRDAEEAARAASFAVASASSDLARASARLQPDRLNDAGRVLSIVAPVDGVVLRRRRESAGVVPAGEPLIEIGDRRDLEIVSDLLSTDAVQVRPGAPVRLEQWGGDRAFTAHVRRVEPSGFIKLSALGVEEQRVNVLMDFDDAAAASELLGDGYRTEVRIVVWEAADVVQVPISALFRHGDGWAVYVIAGADDGGTPAARRVAVEVRHRNTQTAEVLKGLSPGDKVVVHPPDTLGDGMQLAVRAPADRPAAAR